MFSLHHGTPMCEEVRRVVECWAAGPGGNRAAAVKENFLGLMLPHVVRHRGREGIQVDGTKAQW